MQVPILKRPFIDPSLKPTVIPKVIPVVMIKGVSEGYKHLYDRIIALWGHPDFYPFMEGLFLIPSGKGRVDRQGFPQAIMIELHNLSVEHDRQFPRLKKVDPWHSADLEH
jgi:hypothetical protein